MTPQQFIKKHNLYLVSRQRDERPDGDTWPPGSRHYFVTLCIPHHKPQLNTWYSMGSALKGEPNIPDVLESLVLDARCGTESFRNFCDDLGYDEDSRKAYATWGAARCTWRMLRRLLGSDGYTELCSVDFDASHTRSLEHDPGYGLL